MLNINAASVLQRLSCAVCVLDCKRILQLV